MALLPTRTLWRRSAAAGAAVLALSGLAACGGSNDDSSSKGASSGTTTAASGGSDSGSSGTSSTGDLKSGDKVSSAQMADIVKKATTSMSTAHMKMDMDMSSGGQSQQVTAEGDVQTKPLAEHLTMSLSGTNVELILVDKTMYMKAPGMGTGSTWVKVDSSQLSKLGGGAMSDAMTDPLSMVKELSGSIQGAAYAGKQSVGGTDADHYTLKVDTKKLMSSLGGGSSTASLPATMTEDLWVDSQGRLIQSKVDMGSPGTVTVQVSKQGQPVKIQAPPASQVTQMPSAG